MKILHFLWALDNGGAENLAIDLANEQSLENEVVFFIGNDRIDEAVRARIAPAVRIVQVGRPANSRNPYWLARMLVVLHMQGADVVHAHSSNLAKLGSLIAAPMVLTVHDTHIQLDKSAKKFAVLCCISGAVTRDVTSRYAALRVKQVNNGVNTTSIATGIRQRQSTIRAVQISRLVHEKKGQDLLIRALAQVNADPTQPRLTIDFVGDGPSLQHLAEIARDVGVSEFCHFLGAQSRDQIYQTLWQYDMLVQPSRYEGFGLTVAEGMTAGVSVVVSDVEGPMEIINDGEYGYHFKSGDAVSLANTLNRVMAEMDSPNSALTREAAKKHATSSYDLRLTSKHYCQIYREVAHA